jgi:aminopeptidase
MPIDLRAQQLAKLIVDYSVFVKKGEKVIISGAEEARDFVVALYKEVILKGAHPILRFRPSGLAGFFYRYANKEQLEKFPDEFDYIVKNANKYIGISTETNTRELTSCDSKKITAREKVVHPISDYVVNEKPKIYRCTVGFPCMALAQEAEMDLTDYENFLYSACLQDWKEIGKKINKIADKFRNARKVWLKGEGVDLKFENGKVIESKADKNEDFLKQMLATDENSSYVGEFGIGMNPKINKFTKDLLFDEKIGGTIHLALGMAYKENGGGNDSAIHWDIVKDMKKAKIILDGKVVQDKGKWKI